MNNKLYTQDIIYYFFAKGELFFYVKTLFQFSSQKKENTKLDLKPKKI